MSNAQRIGRLQQRFDAESIDALLVTGLTNVRYLTGFSGTNGQVLVTPSDAFFFSDGRYRARAAETVTGAEVVIYDAGLADVLPERLQAAKVTKLGIEARTMTVAERSSLAEKLEGIELVPTIDWVESLRRRKDADEIAFIRQAVQLTDDAFAWVLDRLVVGVTTERQVALDLEIKMRQDGADRVAFEPIVGSGPLSAHIHHTPSDRVLERGDLVLFDFGCVVEGYCSDLTRTVSLGPPADGHREIYDLVYAAQLAGVDAVGPGIAGKEADAVARAVIDEGGHADDFGHGLGHGVGLDVHEAPRLHWASDDVLAPGDVVTVEPGVYVIGTGGIRIEDDVLITDGGAEVLNKAPKKELIEI